MSGEQPWWLTTVYGPQEDADKVLFLEELEAIRDDCQGPWVVAGDFNLILDPADRGQKQCQDQPKEHGAFPPNG